MKFLEKKKVFGKSFLKKAFYYFFINIFLKKKSKVFAFNKLFSFNLNK